MKPMRRIDRRDFAKEASLAFLGGMTVAVSACGGGDGGYQNPANGTPPTTTAAAPPTGDKVGQISANHGHSAVVTSAQLVAGGAVNLDISGGGGHAHFVALPEQAVKDMRDGKAVQKESTSGDGHTHLVTFNAESPEPPIRY